MSSRRITVVLAFSCLTGCDRGATEAPTSASLFESYAKEVDGVALGGETTVEFPFGNGTGRELKLLRATASCGCAGLRIECGGDTFAVGSTTAGGPFQRVGGDVVDSKEELSLPSGARGKLAATIASDARDIERVVRIRVYTNHPGEPVATLRIRVGYAQLLKLEPAEVVMSEVPYDREQDFEIRVRPGTAGVPADLTVTADDARIDVVLVNQGDTALVRGRVAPPRGATPGLTSRIRLVSPSLALDASIRVIVDYREAFDVLPGKVVALGVLDPTTAVERSVDLVARDDWRFQDASAEPFGWNLPPEAVYVEEWIADGGKRLGVRVRLAPTLPKRLVRGEVTVDTGHPFTRQVKLLFVGRTR